MSNDDWQDLDLRAISAVCLSLTDDMVYNVKYMSSAKEFWKEFVGLSMMKSLQIEVVVVYCTNEGTEINDHLYEFNKDNM